MEQISYIITSDDEGSNIVVYAPGIKPQVAHSSHPLRFIVFSYLKSNYPNPLVKVEVSLAVARVPNLFEV